MRSVSQIQPAGRKSRALPLKAIEPADARIAFSQRRGVGVSPVVACTIAAWTSASEAPVVAFQSSAHEMSQKPGVDVSPVGGSDELPELPMNP